MTPASIFSLTPPLVQQGTPLRLILWPLQPHQGLAVYVSLGSLEKMWDMYLSIRYTLPIMPSYWLSASCFMSLHPLLFHQCLNFLSQLLFYFRKSGASECCTYFLCFLFFFPYLHVFYSLLYHLLPTLLGCPQANTNSIMYVSY